MALNVKSSETVVIPEASDLADVSTTRTYFAGSLQKHRAGAHSHDISVGVAVALICVFIIHYRPQKSLGHLGFKMIREIKKI